MSTIAQLTSNPIKNIFANGVCIDINVSVWTGRKNAKVAFEQLGIDRSIWDEHVLAGAQLCLVAKDQMNKFKSLEQKARNRIIAYSFPFMNNHFVPYTAIKTVMEGDDGLSKIKQQFDDLVVDFLKDFDTIRDNYIEEQSKKNPVYGDVIRAWYPTKASVEEKFNMSWRMYEISIPQSTEDDGDSEVTIDDAIRRATYISEIKTQMHQEASRFATGIVDDMRTQLSDALGNFNKLLSSNSTVKTSSFDAVRTAIDRFRQMNFLNDDTIENELSALESSLSGVGSVKSDQTLARHAIGDAIKSVEKAMFNTIDEAKRNIHRKLDI